MRHHRSITLLVLFWLVALGAAALTPAEEEARRSESYRAGQAALDAERWSEAVDRFAEAVARDDGATDAALYWQAYALLQLNRPARAELLLERLQESYPESNWTDDARALEIEAQQAGRRPVDPEQVAGEELKLVALNSLMHVEWQRARPILEQLVRGGSSPRVMERALFILSQSDEPEARGMLLEAARDGSNPELAEEAIEYLAFFDDDQTRADLRQLYRDLDDVELKEQVLESLMIADDLETLFQLAKSEPDEKLRGTAVEQLGLLDARDQLRQLYQSETSSEVKDDILEAFMLADDLETLLSLARSEPDPELRSSAIEMVGLLDGVTELRDLYRSESSAKVRADIAEAMMLADDAEFLLEIATTDPDAGVREDAIEGLGLIDSPASSAALAGLYASASDVETKKAIIEAFMYQDDATRLIEIVRNETALELRKEALEMLALMDSDEATEFMLRILEEGG